MVDTRLNALKIVVIREASSKWSIPQSSSFLGAQIVIT